MNKIVPYVCISEGRIYTSFLIAGHQCHKNMMKDICIPYTIVRGYICSFSLLKM